MQLKVEMMHTLTLTTEELRLVLAGLHGSLRPEQMPDAIKLQEQIVKAKRDVLSNIVGASNQTLQKIKQTSQDNSRMTEEP